MNSHIQVCVILGHKGTGKSTVLNESFDLKPDDQFPVGDSESHVTTKQEEKKVTLKIGQRTRSIILVDSPGWDTKENNRTSLIKYDGKRVCLIFLNNDLRVEESRRQIRKLFGKKAIVNAYNSYVAREDLCGLPNVQQFRRDLENNQLHSFVYESPFQPRAVQNGNAPTSARELKIPRHPLKAVYPTKSNDYFSAGLKKMVKNLTLEEVKKHRIAGDYRQKLNMYYLLESNMEQFEQIISNKCMSDFLCHHGCKDDIHKLYESNGDHELSEEKIADVYEALVEKTFLVKFQRNYQFHNLLLEKLIEFVGESLN